MNVFLADIPIYDVTRELVLLNQQRIAEIDIAWVWLRFLWTKCAISWLFSTYAYFRTQNPVSLKYMVGCDIICYIEDHTWVLMFYWIY